MSADMSPYCSAHDEWQAVPYIAHLARTRAHISRDDRARIATCRLRTPTDRLKENYSIDSVSEL